MQIHKHTFIIIIQLKSKTMHPQQLPTRNKHLKSNQRYQTLPHNQHQKHHLSEFYQSRNRPKIITHSRENYSTQFVNMYPQNKSVSNNDLNHFSRAKKVTSRILKNRRYSEANSPQSFSGEKKRGVPQRRSLKYQHRLHSELGLNHSQQKSRSKSIKADSKYKQLPKKKQKIGIFNKNLHELSKEDEYNGFASQEKMKTINQETVSYLQKMHKIQAQKNQRIKSIYNPTPKTKSIGLLRSKMPINATLNKLAPSYPPLQQNNKKTSTIDLPFSNLPSTLQVIRKQQKANISQKIKIEDENTIPKISQLTKQKIQQLSVIREQMKNNETSKTSRSENKMPLPKFSKFYDSYAMQTNTGSFSVKSGKNNEENKRSQIEDQQNQISHSGKRSISGKQIKSQNQVPLLEFLSDLQEYSEVKIIKETNGVYYGQVDEAGKKFGRGVYFHHSGTTYQGQFENGQKNGHGKETFPDGSSYLGNFKNDLREGKGRFQWPNGQIYDGQWKENLKHGSGLWEDPNGSSYLGQWREDQISGFGVLTSLAKNGENGYERFEGEFQNFSKEGHGTYRFANGQKINGVFHKNQPNGECQYYWPNGDYFKGMFINGLRHGKGHLKYDNGSEFEGQFRNDKKCGFGRQTYNDGISYVGNFENDLRHGYGKLEYNEVIYYEGYWLNNRAVIFQTEDEKSEEYNEPGNSGRTNLQDFNKMEPIEEDVINERLVSRFSKNLSKQKLDRLNSEEKGRIIKALKSREKLNKSGVHRFSSKNLLQRLYNPKKRACRCAAKH